MSSVRDVSDDSEQCSISERTSLPATKSKDSNLNFWSYLKRCIGKELSRITMPVEWNEPLSLLQRLSENMRFSHLLQIGCEQTDPVRRMYWVSAFAVSALSSNFRRIGKPFNPLLGETFELERDDFRMVCEQVGHHPPVSAYHVESKQKGLYELDGVVDPVIKFRGKYLQFTPKGKVKLTINVKGREDEDESDVISWNNVSCLVHNIIVGSLWIEYSDIMILEDFKNKISCHLSFKRASSTSSSSPSKQSDQNSKSNNTKIDTLGPALDPDAFYHCVEGFIVQNNKNGEKKGGEKIAFIYGNWTYFMCVVTKLDHVCRHLGVKDLGGVSNDASNLPKHGPLDLGEIETSEILWQSSPTLENDYYNFSPFTFFLNDDSKNDRRQNGFEKSFEGSESIPELSKVCSKSVRDSRNRSDVRALENGDLQLAASEKERLEVRQRENRKLLQEAYISKLKDEQENSASSQNSSGGALSKFTAISSNKKKVPSVAGLSEKDWWSPRWFEKIENDTDENLHWNYKRDQSSSELDVIDIFRNSESR